MEHGSRRNRPRLGRRLRLSAIFLILLASIGAVSSCSSRLGWGLVLWTSPDGKIPAGAVVPVYIKSNINHVYVVGTPDRKAKIELPLWQVELHGSKGKAKAAAAAFSGVSSLYLIAARDGLPVRLTPTNAANRVYRLREGQSVKVLERAEGEVVRSGDTPLEGDWYYVLTEDGTRGYVFSNTMRLFDEKTEAGAAPVAAGASASAVKIDTFFTRQWRPAYFQEMDDSGRPDLDVFNPRFGIFVDAVRRQIRLELPAASEVFTYTTISEDNGSFVFEGSLLRIKFLGERRLVADWTGQPIGSLDASQPAAAAVAAPPAKGSAQPKGAASAAPGTQAVATPPAATEAEGQAASLSTSWGGSGRAEFVILPFDIRDVAHTEELRRQRLLDAFMTKGSDWSLLILPTPVIVEGGQGATPASTAESGVAVGGEAAASAPAAQAPAAVAQPSASRLQVSGDGRFRWTRAELVPPGYIPALPPSAEAATGDIAFRLHMTPALQAAWDGVLSLRFDAAPGNEWVDFLWKADGSDIILAPCGELPSQDAASPSPLTPLRLSPARNR